MAKKTNSKSKEVATGKTSPPPAADIAPVNVERKRQVRLGFGIFFIFAGAYVCLSIVSYFYTWTKDQSDLITATGAWKFLRADQAHVANMGGRLGAVLSHILVFKGAGIASLAIGLDIAAIGMHCSGICGGCPYCYC